MTVEELFAYQLPFVIHTADGDIYYQDAPPDDPHSTDIWIYIPLDRPLDES